MKITDTNEFKTELLSEAKVLMLVILRYQAAHFDDEGRSVVDGRKWAAGCTGASPQHIADCLAGKCCIGDERWAKLMAEADPKGREAREKWLKECGRRATQ